MFVWNTVTKLFGLFGIQVTRLKHFISNILIGNFKKKIQLEYKNLYKILSTLFIITLQIKLQILFVYKELQISCLQRGITNFLFTKRNYKLLFTKDFKF